eukprot:5434297-Alexandrium_andersonii.AAC.1
MYRMATFPNPPAYVSALDSFIPNVNAEAQHSARSHGNTVSGGCGTSGAMHPLIENCERPGPIDLEVVGVIN